MATAPRNGVQPRSGAGDIECIVREQRIREGLPTYLGRRSKAWMQDGSRVCSSGVPLNNTVASAADEFSFNVDFGRRRAGNAGDGRNGVLFGDEYRSGQRNIMCKSESQ